MILLSKIKPSNLDWQTLNISAPFTPSVQDYETPKYARTADKLVILEGLVRHASIGSGVVAVLPAGYRPSKMVVFLVAAGNGTAHIYIYPTGNIELTTQINGWVSISGIVFSIA